MECFNFPLLEALPIDMVVSTWDNGVMPLLKADQVPYFKKYDYTSGTQPNQTTWELTETTPLFRVEDRSPRLVIWKAQEPLALCSTETLRIDSVKRLPYAIEFAIKWSLEHTTTKDRSIAVVDLDDTLIDEKDRLLKCAKKLLTTIRQRYDIVVLYSHGNDDHVDYWLNRLKVPLDLVLCNNKTSRRCQKNLLQLYNHFPGVRFTKAILVDDSLFNWTPEYSRMLIPHGLCLTNLDNEL